MSIDAQIKSVIVNEDGSGELILIDRPDPNPNKKGIRGQNKLIFDKITLSNVLVLMIYNEFLKNLINRRHLPIH